MKKDTIHIIDPDNEPIIVEGYDSDLKANLYPNRTYNVPDCITVSLYGLFRFFGEDDHDTIYFSDHPLPDWTGCKKQYDTGEHEQTMVW